MLRQVSSRNQRSKGLKIKHVLQISLLTAVCIWLIFQIKHSHDKRRALQEKNMERLNQAIKNDGADFVKFGRKDLPRGSSISNIVKDKEQGEETQEEEHDETKQDQTEDEEKRGRLDDDDIDEQDHEKDDEDSEQDQEQTAQNEDKGHHNENKDIHDGLESQDNEGNTQEAREENYKRDDASSAVVHNTQTTEFEQLVDKVGNDSGANDSKGDTDSGTSESKPEDNSGANDSKGDADSSVSNSKAEDNSGINNSKVDEDLGLDSSGHDDSSSSDLSQDGVVGDNLEKKTLEEARNVLTVGAESLANNVTDLRVAESTSNVSDTPLKDNETMKIGDPFSDVTSANFTNTEVESKPDNNPLTESVPINQVEQPNVTVTELQSNSTGIMPDASSAVNTSYYTSLSSVGDENSNSTNNDTSPQEDARDLERLEGEPAGKSEAAAATTSATTVNGGLVNDEFNDQSHPVTEEKKDTSTDTSTIHNIQNVAKSRDGEASE